MECEHKECRLEKVVLEARLSTTKMVLNQVLGKLHRLQNDPDLVRIIRREEKHD